MSTPSDASSASWLTYLVSFSSFIASTKVKLSLDENGNIVNDNNSTNNPQISNNNIINNNKEDDVDRLKSTVAVTSASVASLLLSADKLYSWKMNKYVSSVMWHYDIAFNHWRLDNFHLAVLLGHTNRVKHYLDTLPELAKSAAVWTSFNRIEFIPCIYLCRQPDVFRLLYPVNKNSFNVVKYLTIQAVSKFARVTVADEMYHCLLDPELDVDFDVKDGELGVLDHLTDAADIKFLPLVIRRMRSISYPSQASALDSNLRHYVGMAHFQPAMEMLKAGYDPNCYCKGCGVEQLLYDIFQQLMSEHHILVAEVLIARALAVSTSASVSTPTSTSIPTILHLPMLEPHLDRWNTTLLPSVRGYWKPTFRLLTTRHPTAEYVTTINFLDKYLFYYRVIKTLLLGCCVTDGLLQASDCPKHKTVTVSKKKQQSEPEPGVKDQHYHRWLQVATFPAGTVATFPAETVTTFPAETVVTVSATTRVEGEDEAQIRLKQEQTRRYFKIVSCLPLDLQVVVVLRLYGSSANVISSESRNYIYRNDFILRHILRDES